MTKIKEIPKINRPREKFLEKGPEALSKSDLLAILIGSGIKGKNVRQLSEQIIKKYSKDFLNLKVTDLIEISGIGKAKALQIVSAISLVKRFYEEEKSNEIIVSSLNDVLTLNYDLRNKKKEYLICLYLNPANKLIKKEIISVGLLDKSLFHSREVFQPAFKYNSSRIILVHNHPTGDSTPSNKDLEIIKKVAYTGHMAGIPVLDFIIIAKNDNYSFYNYLRKDNLSIDYVASNDQLSIFDLLELEEPKYDIKINKSKRIHFHKHKTIENYFQLQNRRYLGNKFKLLGFIEDIVEARCGEVHSFCDIFAGTGVVGERFNKPEIKIISNDFLHFNYLCLKTFIGTSSYNEISLNKKIDYLNGLEAQENYFSKYFSNTYFTLENAKKIGTIREEIDNISDNENEKNILLCSLLYAVDKVANTVGHYDAFRKKLDMTKSIKLLIPNIDNSHNINNEIYKMDANKLIIKINCDVLYIDPPYNSRQYSDAYHLLENLAKWEKPEVFGKANKMVRTHIKSEYCLKSATTAFEDLINNANCKHILLSYNNTGSSKDGRSNARIDDNSILRILQNKGDVEIFERDYKAFTTGKSSDNNNVERIFYCRVKEN